jgi:membrane protein YdbS with pleckstrin-like domain
METQDKDGPVVWVGQPAWSSYIFIWIFAAILGVRGVASLWMGYWYSGAFHTITIGMLVALALFLHQTTHYRITRQAIYRTKDLFGKAEQSFPLSTIASVSKQQGPLERLVGSGNVVLHLKDGRCERLSGVKDPEVVCRKITALL